MIRRRHLPDQVPPAVWLVIGAVVLWHAPSMAVGHARRAAARMRFALTMTAVDVLLALGRERAGRNLLATTLRRTRRQEREIKRLMRERRR